MTFPAWLRAAAARKYVIVHPENGEEKADNSAQGCITTVTLIRGTHFSGDIIPMPDVLANCFPENKLTHQS